MSGDGFSRAVVDSLFSTFKIVGNRGLAQSSYRKRVYYISEPFINYTVLYFIERLPAIYASLLRHRPAFKRVSVFEEAPVNAVDVILHHMIAKKPRSPHISSQDFSPTELIDMNPLLSCLTFYPSSSTLSLCTNLFLPKTEVKRMILPLDGC